MFLKSPSGVPLSWWRHQMETFSALLALCAGNSPVQVNSPHKGQWRGALTFSLISVWINFDYINVRVIELVKSPGLYIIEERRDYFLAMLMFKSIHGIAPAYLCNPIVMNFDINGYDTRGTDGMNVYLPTLKKDIYKNSFLYKGGQVWNRLLDVVKDSPNLETFKYYYKLQKSVTDAWMLYSYIHVSILQCKGKLLNIITPRIDY